MTSLLKVLPGFRQVHRPPWAPASVRVRSCVTVSGAGGAGPFADLLLGGGGDVGDSGPRLPPAAGVTDTRLLVIHR